MKASTLQSVADRSRVQTGSGPARRATNMVNRRFTESEDPEQGERLPQILINLSADPAQHG